jgi:hypothetical protein
MPNEPDNELLLGAVFSLKLLQYKIQSMVVL